MSLGPINLSPTLSGYVADRYGWRVNFWILTAFTAVNLILIISFVPETKYQRPSCCYADVAASGERSPKAHSDSVTLAAHASCDREGEKALSYWQEPKPCTGVRLRDSIWRHTARLCACAMYPAVIWTFLVGGTYSGWVSCLPTQHRTWLIIHSSAA